MDNQDKYIQDYKRAWGFLRMLKSKSHCVNPLFYNQQESQALYQLEVAKIYLSDDQINAINKELENNYS
jgi:hypothetical protein